ncbi:hypothetical protein AB0395_39715 [Streptosporangium sp. NPDC051023]|uniref:hypothetical protein n=1 Tax=Streptosporangium sp. NPDC051023 TaxID=3155410 RepID=UPI003450761A
MAKARFKPNNKSIGAMLRSAKMEQEMVERARLIVSYAQADAPHDSGEYAESFEIDSGQSGSPIQLGTGDRAWAKIRNGSEAAAPLEFGNRRVGEGQRILGRAIDQVSRE